MLNMKIIPINIILLLFIEFIYVLILNRILNIVIILLIKLFIYKKIKINYFEKKTSN